MAAGGFRLGKLLGGTLNAPTGTEKSSGKNVKPKKNNDTNFS